MSIVRLSKYLLLVLGLILNLSLLVLVSTPLSAHAADNESAYERVLKTGKLRCGYVIYNPVVSKDLENGSVSGILPDILEELGKKLNIEVEWTEEIPFTTQFEGLQTGRYDMVCTALWGWPQQARVAELIGPLYFYPLGVWVRTDDNRFNNNLDAINSSEITISGVDGTYPLDAARNDFPNANVISLPETAEYSQPLLDVMTKKADVTFFDNNMGQLFDEANPGKLKNITIDPPYRIFGSFLAVNKGEHNLDSMLQSVIDLMLLDGSIDKILKKYESENGGYYRVNRQYEVSR